MGQFCSKPQLAQVVDDKIFERNVEQKQYNEDGKVDITEDMTKYTIDTLPKNCYLLTNDINLVTKRICNEIGDQLEKINNITNTSILVTLSHIFKSFDGTRLNAETMIVQMTETDNNNYRGEALTRLLLYFMQSLVMKKCTLSIKNKYKMETLINQLDKCSNWKTKIYDIHCKYACINIVLKILHKYNYFENNFCNKIHKLRFRLSNNADSNILDVIATFK